MNDLPRPKIAPELMAALTDAAPGRLVRKLNRAPRLAEAWDWSCDNDAWSVGTPSDESVSLHPDASGSLRSAGGIRCTCLLGPRCPQRAADTAQ